MEQKKVSPAAPTTTPSSVVASISDSVAKGRDGIGNAASEAMDSGASDLKALREDFDGLKETVMNFISKAGGHAVKTAQEVGGHLGGAAQDLAGKGTSAASAATAEAKSLFTEMDNWARRNPIGALATVLMVGWVIGLSGRRS
jgi:ElaB/YqjD/DUF883 family membrane-anchored ribosome-binding protein